MLTLEWYVIKINIFACIYSSLAYWYTFISKIAHNDAVVIFSAVANSASGVHDSISVAFTRLNDVN